MSGIFFKDKSGRIRKLLVYLKKYHKLPSSVIFEKVLMEECINNKVNIDIKLKKDFKRIQRAIERKKILDEIKSFCHQSYSQFNAWARFVDFLLKGNSPKTLKNYLKLYLRYEKLLEPNIRKNEKENLKKIKEINDINKITDMCNKVKELVNRGYNVEGLRGDLAYGYAIFVNKYKAKTLEFDKKSGFYITGGKEDG